MSLPEILSPAELNHIPPAVINLALDNREILYHLGLDPDNLPPPEEVNGIISPRLITDLPTSPDQSRQIPEIQPVLDRIIGQNPGLILIRPDFYHKRNEIIAWLREFGFCPQSEINLTVNERTYELMYADVFNRDPAKFSLPNRTIVYTGSPAQVVIFTDPKKRFSSESLADGFAREFKGSQGIPDSNTLRGSLIYQAAKELGYDRLTDRLVQMAVDPLGTYRYAVRSDGPHSHLPPEDQLLYYTGVGVHIPNLEELRRDIALLLTRNQLEKVALQLEHPNLGYYRSLWDASLIKTPLVIAVGGYAGTGKSSLVNRLSEWLPPSEKLATGQIRAVLKQTILQNENPWLYVSSYKIDEVDPSIPTIDAFMRQVQPVAAALNKISEFAEVEGQHHILDGNHVFPGLITFPDGVIGLEIYLQVSDPEIHRRMLSGPTHLREITEHEFQVARNLHDFIVSEARRLGKPVFEYDEAYLKTLDLLNQKLSACIPDEN